MRKFNIAGAASAFKAFAHHFIPGGAQPSAGTSRDVPSPRLSGDDGPQRHAVRSRDRYDAVVNSGKFVADKLAKISVTQKAEWDRIKQTSSSGRRAVNASHGLANTANAAGAWNKGVAAWDGELRRMRVAGDTNNITATLGISADEKNAIVFALGQSLLDQESSAKKNSTAVLANHNLEIPEGKNFNTLQLAEIDSAITFLKGQNDSLPVFHDIVAEGNSTEFDALLTLIRHGIVDPNHKDVTGKTLLHELVLKTNEQSASTPVDAKNHSFAERLTALVNCGANVNSRDATGQTPLHIATMHATDATMMTVLLDHNADIDAKDLDGDTPLHLAVRHRVAPEKKQALIDRNADVESKNKSGQMPFELMPT